MEPTTLAALFAFLTVVVQVIANQWGAQKAREHELRMAELKYQHIDDDDKGETKL